jgi:hypothetical protein
MLLFESGKPELRLAPRLQYVVVRVAQLAEREFKVMKPTAKPVKRSKKLQSGKKLERKAPLVVRSLVVKW